jgi:hypothetical protein
MGNFRICLRHVKIRYMDAKDLIIEKQAAEIKTLKETIETLREEINRSGKIPAILPSRRRATL